jgi:uracil-DNA glycosylase family 4
MPVTYGELLDATIQHLEALKSRGARHVAVSAETLRSLSQPPPKVGRTFDISSHQPAIPRHTRVLPAGEARGEEESHGPTGPTIQPSEIRNPKSAPEKATAFAALRERVIVCVKCANLASSRKNVVFGVGNIDAQLMFVGEAPGADEDVQGEPFVGRAGELLTRIIQAMGLQRSDVYIANILKCRPDTPGQTAGNRKPTPDEMATCVPYLHEQIDLIQPRVLVALGATAIEGLLGKTLGIMKLRGNWKTYRGTPLMPTFHPAYLLRNQAMTEKRKVWEDMLAVMEKLEMPISDKQRNYFIRG